MRVMYFASLRESLGISEEELDSSASSVAELLDELANRGEQWDQLLKQNTRLQVAINQSMAKRTSALQASDEVAFFPPVTGG